MASSALSCSSTTGSINGYVVFSNGTQVSARSSVQINWSTDSFGSVNFSGASVENLQGFIAVPFQLPITFCDSINVQLRAFQDSNGDSVWQSGEATGRYDGTSDGNSSYKTVSLSSSQATVNGLIIYIDGTTVP